ncbi:MAG: gamma-glutamyl-gamma-aminobutyrate hydrolase family protein [Firmicutes bacterium]|nr:gamma-glutamyl-gamma-aminobutyrate hydrolase family protein [Bacillota bacterium]
MQPVIGVSCCYKPEENRYWLSRDYVQAIQDAGGIPVILPANDSIDPDIILSTVHGLMLPGGEDIEPGLFGEEPWPENGTIDPERDVFEIALAARALQLKMPLLGICRGIQVMNVAGGGSVCQDIARVVDRSYKHSQQAPRWHVTHNIKIETKSTLFGILGQETLRVNSFHHQMVGKLAPGFIISAYSADGVVEGIEMPDDFFCIGVQFHPENLYRRHPIFRSLFNSFTAASARYLPHKTTG